MRYRRKDKTFRTRAAERLLAASGTESIHDAIPRCITDLREKAVARGLHGTAAPPYDPRPLAQMLGVEEVRRIPLDCDGRIVRDGPTLVIELNEQSARSRRARFTLAHEVGHLLLWHSAGAVRAVPVRRHTGSSEVERLCDMLAAEILAPEDDLRRMLKGTTGRAPRAQTVWHVAEKFKTSLHFAAARLQEVLGVKFGAGLANVAGEYWDWHFGIGASKSLMAFLGTTITEPRAIEGGRYFDDFSKRTRSFNAVKVGAERILVVVSE